MDVYRRLSAVMTGVLAVLAALALIAAPAAQANLPGGDGGGTTAPTQKTLSYQNIRQTEEWNCGPTAGQIALGALGINVSNTTLQGLMNTTTDGTNSVDNVAYALNYEIGHASYRSVYIGGSDATYNQAVAWRSAVLKDIQGNKPLVINVMGPGTDTNGTTRTYGYHDASGWHDGHYLAVVGYSHSGDWDLIADSATGTSYWMVSGAVATWIAGHGYVM